MYNILLEKIAAYETIIIHRHNNPDLDALGSQLGLKGIIENNFSNKRVYVVGDENTYNFIGRMDKVDDKVYNGALIIVLDVASSHMVSDDRYKLGKEVIVVDHHLNESDIADIFIKDTSHIAVCQMLIEMVMQHDLKIDSDTATKLLSGLITDSGRFLYPATSSLTFKAAGFLMDQGADIQFIYDKLYDEDLEFKKLKGYFINNFKTTDQNVAYMKNDKHLKDKFDVTTFTISRGMVNQMGGIKGIPIWANFTEEDEGAIICELRSKVIPIVNVAKHYGGGGHELACGCTLHSWEEVDQLINDLNKLVLERT